ncbi:MAG: PilZ domain-containing protein [Candidatus Lambdaproteobacteria bacterium]|nr:PilZ domain-containing protein [Candidatus Lambdaproteobacteria bacterium]
MADYRRFSRVPFLTDSRLVLGGAATACHLADVSLKGALVEAPTAYQPGVGARGTLEIRLGPTELAITMAVECAHRAGDRLGLRCVSIDLDSMVHLRRLLELNLGDASLVERELLSLG